MKRSRWREHSFFMASRHLARSIAMQSLYEWDFNDRDTARLPAIMEKNIAEFGPGLEEIEFIHRIVVGVIEHHDAIDEIIAKAAPEWPIAQIAIVDRNILRVGLYELLYGNREEVPPKVAINEAIELAKNFGGDTSGKFVNGVLGTIYREIGEPGKDYPTREELAKKREEEAKHSEENKESGSAAAGREDRGPEKAKKHKVGPKGKKKKKGK